MITILVVAAPKADLTALAAQHPSVEILVSNDREDALEKLARNRRIDAVLLLTGDATDTVAAAIREEDPGSPPLYAPATAGDISGVRTLPAGSPGKLVALLVHALSADL